MSKPLVSIVTGNSNSGLSCIAELTSKYAGQLNIRAVFRSLEKAEPVQAKYQSLEVVYGVDASKPATLDYAFRGAQSALIVTPFTHESISGASNDSQLAINMINSAVANGVKYIVLVSAWTTPFENLTLVNARFKAPEDLLVQLNKEKKVDFTVLKGGFFSENTYMFKDSIKEKSTINFPNVYIPYVDTRDIGKSAAVCLVSKNGEHNGKFYDMNGNSLNFEFHFEIEIFCFNLIFHRLGPQNLSSYEMAQVFSKVLGREIKLNELSQDLVKQVFPPYIGEIFEYMFKKGPSALPFTNEVHTLTGQNISLEQFIRDHLFIFQ